MTEAQEQLLSEWESDLKLITWSHYQAAASARKYRYYLGVPTVALTALVGTCVFVSIVEDIPVWFEVLIALASILATVLSALQTFMKYSERADEHKEAGSRFAPLVKEIEQAKTFPPEEKENFQALCDSIRERWDRASALSPTVPPHIWRQNREKLKSDP